MPGLTELLIILLIVALLFGTKKLRSMGGDLGSAIKTFRHAVKEDNTEEESATNPPKMSTASSDGTENQNPPV